MSGAPMPLLRVAQVKENLLRILIEGGDENFVIFNSNMAKNYYVQFAGSPNSDRLYGESVGNKFLSPPNQIDQSLLESRGWELGEAGNFAREWALTSDDDIDVIAEFVIEIFVNVYEMDEDQEIQVELNLG